MDFWKTLETYIGESIPECVKIILSENGYNEPLSFAKFDNESLENIEVYTNNHLQHVIGRFNCCLSDIYKSGVSEKTFQFAPGHRNLILAFAKRVSAMKVSNWNHLDDSLDAVLTRVKNEPALSNLLKELVQMALSNFGKPQNRNRYSEFVQYFSAYIFMICGRKCYEFLQNNLPLPSVSTVSGYIQENRVKIVEGELRCNELKVYLDKIKSPHCVWLSEDGSGIVQKVVYDVNTNKLVGLNLPFDESTGMPINSTFMARNLREIEKHMENSKSHLVYIVMAQPVKQNAPPFVLNIFGTNNKFSALNVLRRWKNTEEELNKIGIKVLGKSSDGDPRLLRAMKQTTNFIFNPLSKEDYLLLDIQNPDLCTQDPTHIGTKLRNLLLKPSTLLPFGNKAISLTHLKMLLLKVPKDIHGLTYSDISPDDRQNFGSLKKVMESRVIEALKVYVIDSEATVEFITICNNAVSSFLDRNLTPTERIYRIWNALFLLRIWRKSIQKSNIYQLDSNFITSNAFECIEINAIGLLKLIVSLRERNQPEMFIPYKFDSQPCEETFRHLRSMSSMNWTKINFTMMELLHMIERVELQYDIKYYKLSEQIIFTRNKLNLKHTNPTHILPSNEEIMDSVKRALNDAEQIANKFGMECECDVTKSPIQIQRLAVRSDARRDVEQLELSSNDDEASDEDSIMYRDEELHLRHYASDNLNIPENSKYIQISDKDGCIKNVLKSSIVWLLTDSVGKLSNDRLKRVQATPLQKLAKRPKLNRVLLDGNINASINVYEPTLLDEIHLGDWCQFEYKNEENMQQLNNMSEASYIKDFVFGCVLGFRWKEGNSEKKKQYHIDFARIMTDEDKNIRRTDIEVLSNWYASTCDGNKLISIGSLFFISIEHYMATIKSPKVIENENNEQILKIE